MHVGFGGRCGCGVVAGDVIDVLGHVTGAHAADYRHVVGAVDGDGDDPVGGAIARDRGEGSGERRAGKEWRSRWSADDYRKRKRAVGRERDGAEANQAWRTG